MRLLKSPYPKSCFELCAVAAAVHVAAVALLSSKEPQDRILLSYWIPIAKHFSSSHFDNQALALPLLEHSLKLGNDN